MKLHFNGILSKMIQQIHHFFVCNHFTVKVLFQMMIYITKTCITTMLQCILKVSIPGQPE